jgi:hypothetical protein
MMVNCVQMGADDPAYVRLAEGLRSVLTDDHQVIEVDMKVAWHQTCFMQKSIVPSKTSLHKLLRRHVLCAWPQHQTFNDEDT